MDRRGCQDVAMVVDRAVMLSHATAAPEPMVVRLRGRRRAARPPAARVAARVLDLGGEQRA